ncbi:MAG TPA: Gfo/Idh/MocA family oxidoreductase [Cytophagales bacterium]|nr:Gfo/Idh/MocA family oxidoreductase [Cytophagales bacterium]
MNKPFNRRTFIKASSLLGLSLMATGKASCMFLMKDKPAKGNRIGIIGLDTSHCIAFTKIFNDPAASQELGGYKVVAAYPKGSNDIEVSVSRIPGFTKEIQGLGVKIVSSIAELLDLVDVVLLETNDGRLHLEQALPVLKAGKRMFIDKPLSATLPDAIALFEAAKYYNVPIFSSSSLRYFENTLSIDTKVEIGYGKSFLHLIRFVEFSKG